jgi:hypothetical protein
MTKKYRYNVLSSTISTSTNSFSITFTRPNVKHSHQLQFLICKNMDEAAYRTSDIGTCMIFVRYRHFANVLTEAIRPSAAQRFAESPNENPPSLCSILAEDYTKQL